MGFAFTSLYCFTDMTKPIFPLISLLAFVAGTNSLLCLCTVLSPMGSLLIIHISVSLSLLSSVGKIEFCCPRESWQGR